MEKEKLAVNKKKTVVPNGELPNGSTIDYNRFF